MKNLYESLRFSIFLKATTQNKGQSNLFLIPIDKKNLRNPSVSYYRAFMGYKC